MTDLNTRIKDHIGNKPADVWHVKYVIREILAHFGTVSSDEVRFYVKSFHPSSQVVGAAFQALIKEGWLVKSGSKKSTIRSARGREIAIYKQA